MGTSRSSTGSPSGVPLVPPWADSVEPSSDDNSPTESEADNGDSGEDPQEKKPESDAEPLAPPARFRSTRTSLGKFASSGDKNAMRQGVGRYVKTGLGGSRTATRRLSGTARAAGSLYAALGGKSVSAREGRALDAALLQGRSAREIINVVIEIACPVNGTQDAEASRNSINDALSDLLQTFPDADLLDLSEEQRLFVIERFVGMDVYRRFILDVGNTIQTKAGSATVALARMKEVRDYIRETVSASFRKLSQTGQALNGMKISQFVSRALSDSLDVFAGYAE